MGKNIRFSHDYPKLWNQEYALLLNIKKTGVESLSRDLIEYDTKKSDGDYYQLPENCDVIILCFVGDKDIPFTTIRRYTKSKYDYYKSSVGEWFKIKIE